LNQNIRVTLALQLIEAGGFHISFLLPLWDVCHKKQTTTFDKKALATFIEAVFPAQTKAYILEELKKLKNDAWRSHYALFSKTEFFDLMVGEGITTLEELFAMWKQYAAYGNSTALTTFLLKNKTHIDKNFFLHPHLSPLHLRIKGIDFLFEEEDESFDRRIFLQKFVVGKTLDLHNTYLTNFPTIALEIIDSVDTLNLNGTRIRKLPWEVLTKIKDIKANKKTMRGIYGQIMGLNRFDYFYAQKIAYKKGVMWYETKHYEKALPYFELTEKVADNPFFEVYHKNNFWQAFFNCLLKLGKLEEAIVVLKRALPHLPYPNVSNCHVWANYWVEFLVADREGEVLEILEQYIPEYNLQGNTVAEYVGLTNDFLWCVMNEKLAYQNRFQEIFKLLEKAPNYCSQLYTPYWTWIKIFRHLRDHKYYEDIILLYEHHEHTIFFENGVPKQPIDRHNRCVWTWIEAYIAVGKLDKAELLCSYYLQIVSKNMFNKTEKYWEYYASLHYLRLVYPYLYQIYQTTGRQVCAEYYKTEAEQMPTKIQEEWNNRVKYVKYS
jgi:tetratricopeptide (TPR) repeat protein